MILRTACISVFLFLAALLSTTAHAGLVGKSISFSISVYRDGQPVPTDSVRIYVGNSAVYDYGTSGNIGRAFPFGKRVSIGTLSLRHSVAGNTLVIQGYSNATGRLDVTQFVRVQGNTCSVRYKLASSGGVVTTTTNNCEVSNGNAF